MELDLNHDLHSLLPPFYREIAEYQQVCDAEKAQFSRTADSVRVIGQNFFVQTMDADSVQKWEQVLHIRAKPLTETLSFRRQRILSRLCTLPLHLHFCTNSSTRYWALAGGHAAWIIRLTC